MDIFFGLVAGIAIAFAVFNKTITVRITHKHEYDVPPVKEYDEADEKKALEEAQEAVKESTAAYNKVMQMFSGIEVNSGE